MFLKVILLSLFWLSLSAQCTSNSDCPSPSVCCVANGLCMNNLDDCTSCNPFQCPSGCCNGNSCASSCGGGDGPNAIIFIGAVIAVIVVIILASICSKAFYNQRPAPVMRAPRPNFAGQQAQPVVAPPYSIPIIEVEAPNNVYAKDAPNVETQVETAIELNNSDVARHLQRNKEDLIRNALQMQEILVDQGIAPGPKDKLPKV